MLRLLGAGTFASVPLRRSYLDVAHPGAKPAGWAERLGRIDSLLSEPGRMKALQGMGRSAPTDAGAQLGNVRCPILVVMGTLDPDRADPHAEGSAIVDALPSGLGAIEPAPHHEMERPSCESRVTARRFRFTRIMNDRTPPAHSAGLLTGRTVMITGASSGIGEAAARLFASEGAAVVLMARREDRLRDITHEIETSGGQAACSVGDVTRADDVERAVATAVEYFGSLDGAFNNAGYAGSIFGPSHELPEEDFDRVMDVNVRGTWNCLRRQIPVMLDAGHGAIVNTASSAGLIATGAPSPYVAAKHAVLGLTKATAAEYGAYGIRVNSLIVGTTRTEMVNAAVTATPALEEVFVARQIQKRMAEPQEVAEAALWLLSDRSSFATGSHVAVDGGILAI
ncbi:glucose 1-dehydrogenase [Streptomyces sp. NPDC018352]|uniref:SDR family NAD(P)-dependent oxidoreductase n=1 Tax=Streptomyces sp. NPDC018352 TaxID=3157194 RepID=UPI003407F1AD